MIQRQRHAGIGAILRCHLRRAQSGQRKAAVQQCHIQKTGYGHDCRTEGNREKIGKKARKGFRNPRLPVKQRCNDAVTDTPYQIQHGDQFADCHTENRTGGRAGDPPSEFQRPSRKQQTEQQFSDRLQHLRYRRRFHISRSLIPPAQTGLHGNQNDSRRNGSQTQPCLRFSEQNRETVRPDRQTGCKNHGKQREHHRDPAHHPSRLIGFSACERFGHQIGFCHRNSCRTNDKQNGKKLHGKGEHPHPAVSDQIGQRNFEQRTQYFDDTAGDQKQDCPMHVPFFVLHTAPPLFLFNSI